MTVARLLCALALAAGVVPGGARATPAPDSIVLGVLLPATDERAAFALEAGVRLRVDAVAASTGAASDVRLVLRSLTDGWSAGRTVVQMAFDDGVHAVIGGVDGRSAHVIEQLVAKRRMPFVSPWASLSLIHI